MLRKSGPTRREYWEDKHKFEHWYRDNTVYFVTARCRDKHPCFASPEACAIFWDRFTHYTTQHHFEPWVTTLMNNHYHIQHLDVKPENLLLVGGRVKVADFGLVKDLHDAAASMMGGLTPIYAPPEVFEDQDAMKEWVGGAVQAGIRGAKPRRARKKKPVLRR